MLGIDTVHFIMLVLLVIATAAFEFINGFHDTANAVATVIYTNSLKPKTAGRIVTGKQIGRAHV